MVMEEMLIAVNGYYAKQKLRLFHTLLRHTSHADLTDKAINYAIRIMEQAKSQDRHHTTTGGRRGAQVHVQVHICKPNSHWL